MRKRLMALMAPVLLAGWTGEPAYQGVSLIAYIYTARGSKECP